MDDPNQSAFLAIPTLPQANNQRWETAPSAWFQRSWGAGLSLTPLPAEAHGTPVPPWAVPGPFVHLPH